MVITVDDKSIKKPSALTHSIHSLFERLPERVIEYYRMYNIPLFTRKGGEKEETEEINSVNKESEEEEECKKADQILNPESIDVSVELSDLTSDALSSQENANPTDASEKNDSEGVTNETNKA